MTLQKFLRNRGPWLALALTAAYIGSAYVNARFIQGPDQRSALWTSNAFVIFGLLVLTGRWRVLCLLASVVGLSVVVYFGGGGPGFAATAGVSAALSGLAGAWLFHVVLRHPRLRTVQQATKLVCFVAIPVSLQNATMSAMFLHFGLGFPLSSSDIMHSFMASFLGISMVLPALLMLATPAAIEPPKRSRLENFLLLLCGAAILAAPYTGRYYLALLLTFPLANVLALRLGGKATGITLLVLNLATFTHPFLLDRGVLQISSPGLSYLVILAFQVCTIVVFYNGLLTAFAMDHQARVKRQLMRRTAMARKARADAQAASKVKTEFLATMSHEVRTPLNSILGFSQVLERRTDLAPEARRQLTMIQRSGEALLTIVNDILDFSKVEAGMLELDPRPAQIAEVVAEALAIVEPSAREKGLEMSLTTQGNIDQHHLVDDARLRQILLNFLNNAVKFTADGSVRAELAVTAGEDGADAIRIAVTDTGVGVAPEAQARLFQRFSQADNSISRRYGGAGLGLSICRALAELMGGRVGVDSVAGRGATFWLEIMAQRCVAAEEADATADHQGLSAHILLVDDNAANRELGVTILTLLGCTADVACDGAEAVAAAQAAYYDLILMDVHMPHVDGLAAARAIRALDGRAALAPIIAMSADVLPEQVERCLAAGMVDSVAKPVNVQHLHDCLARWLGRDANGAERAAA